MKFEKHNGEQRKAPLAGFFVEKMSNGVILGEKNEMGRIFTDKGRLVPITRIKIKTKRINLKPGDSISITGVSKGKGFTGVMKRWGFKGGPRTHGQSDRQRAPGSIGQTTSPGRIWKGKKMPGRAGCKTVTIKNLKVLSIDEKNKILAVNGPVPGARKGVVKIKKCQE